MHPCTPYRQALTQEEMAPSPDMESILGATGWAHPGHPPTTGRSVLSGRSSPLLAWLPAPLAGVECCIALRCVASRRFTSLFSLPLSLSLS